MSLWAQVDCGLRIVSVDSSYSVEGCFESCNLVKHWKYRITHRLYTSLDFSLSSYLNESFIYLFFLRKEHVSFPDSSLLI